MNRSSKIDFFNVWLKWLGIFVILIGICGCDSFPPFKSTASQIQDASGSLANQLAANLTTNQKLRVGILPLNEKNGKVGTLAQALQESLKNRLFLTKRFDVVEDDDMQKVLKELKIQEQGEGILRGDTIHRMGELLGADAIVYGTITEVGNNYLIDCRLIPITSGIVGSAGEARIAKEAVYSPAPSYNQSQPGGVNYQNTSPTYYNQGHNATQPGYNYKY